MFFSFSLFSRSLRLSFPCPFCFSLFILCVSLEVHSLSYFALHFRCVWRWAFTMQAHTYTKYFIGKQIRKHTPILPHKQWIYLNWFPHCHNVRENIVQCKISGMFTGTRCIVIRMRLFIRYFFGDCFSHYKFSVWLFNRSWILVHFPFRIHQVSGWPNNLQCMPTEHFERQLICCINPNKTENTSKLIGSEYESHSRCLVDFAQFLINRMINVCLPFLFYFELQKNRFVGQTFTCYINSVFRKEFFQANALAYQSLYFTFLRQFTVTVGDYPSIITSQKKNSTLTLKC